MQKKEIVFILATAGPETYMAANVCLGINENYGEEQYDIVVLYNNTPVESVKALNNIPNVTTVNFAFEKKFKECMIKNAYRGSKIRSENSLMAFAHFEIFRYLNNYKKVVWFDTDILIQKGINELIKNEAVFTATADVGWSVGKNFNGNPSGYNLDIEGLCSAVLVINDTAPYESMTDWCYNKAMELAPILFNRDQGIINLAVQEFDITVNYLEIDKWQCMPWNEKASDAIIVHFGGSNKIDQAPNLIKKFPLWSYYHAKWLELGGGDIQIKRAPFDVKEELFEISCRKQYLDLESKRVDEVVRIAKERSRHEEENYRKKKDLTTMVEEGELEPWLIPKNRTTTALMHLLKDDYTANVEVIKSVSNQAHKNQIAIVFGGGLGDALKPMAIVPQLVNELECEVTVVSDQKATFELKKNNPYIKNVIYNARNPYEYAERYLIHADLFDAVIVIKYTISYYLSPSCKINGGKISKVATLSKENKKQYDKYNFNNLGWPGMNNALSRELIKNGECVSSIMAKSSGLEINEKYYTSIPLFLRCSSIKGLLPLLKSKYVTVHYGFDIKKLPDVSEKTYYNCTKNVSLIKWQDIVSKIASLGIKIIQLGADHESKIDNVDYYLNGQTSLEQTALILKNSLCHVDTEGGLVHLARAVHTRSVVMFGPTPVGMFGYPQNINLEPQGCRECFWTTQSWVLKCPRNTTWPDCMEEHTPSTILDALTSVISEKKVVTADIIDSKKDTNQLAEIIIKHVNRISHPSILAVCGHNELDTIQSAADKIDRIINYNITREDDEETLVPIGDRIEYGSYINLRHPPASYEMVICYTHFWLEEHADHILNEMMRVLSDNGILVIVCPKNINFQSFETLEKIKITNPSEFSDDSRILVIRKNGPRDSDQPIIPIRDYEIRGKISPSIKKPVTESPLASDLIVMHKSVNDRLQTAYDYYQENLDAENKNWENSDNIIKNHFFKEGWIKVGKESVEQYGNKFLIENWYEPEDWGCWGKGTEHSLLLPIDNMKQDCKSIECNIKVQVRFGKGIEKQKIEFAIDNCKIHECEFYHKKWRGVGNISIKIPNEIIKKKRFLILDLKTHDYYKPSVNELNSTDNRKLGVGLIAFNCKRIKL
jgi:lipopolysaccharide biosynthesis glycosyltransferase